MEFASIGSGSEGNGTLIRRKGHGCILLDCGFSARETLGRITNLGLGAEDLGAILVTHEHTDHIKGVAALAKRHKIPVYTTWGTWAAKLNGVLDDSLFHLISPHETFQLQGLQVQPLPVPHDAREPCQFVFTSVDGKLGVLSDVGSITPHMLEIYNGCDSLLLECNHDLDMLINGPYPQALKRRVAGPMGHLSNEQSAQMLKKLNTEKLKHVVITHISQKNNHPDLALQALLSVGACDSSGLQLADQQNGFEWLSTQTTI